jgi:hypothetical protein
MAGGLALAGWLPAAEQAPWPADVPSFTAPAPGEHPRLLFRRSDLPSLREKARTPEGQAILDRLRKCLNGSDGESMPSSFNPEVGPIQSDGSGAFANDAPLGTYTISHMAGYGLLYQLTGDKKYADLGRQCLEKALEGYRDRDRRYSFKAPYGALRSGPSLGWTALGYDLCYDGWDEATRRKAALALQNYNEGKWMSLEELVRGARQHPGSNHWGMQVGGGALAVLAIMNDPGVDMAKVGPLLETSQKSMIRNMTDGFGDGGFFAEGDGTGSMASHIAFLTALQAWKTAGGKDFITPRPNAQWMALKWIFLTIPRDGQMDFWPKRGGYPQNVWDRDGLSGGGYFGIGFGSVTPPQRAAALWFYNQHLKAIDEKNGTPFDTPSPYPHHAVCSFVNWPLEIEAENPGDVLPHSYRDSKWSFYAFRNRWQDDNDIVISVLTKRARGNMQARPEGGLMVIAFGKKFKWGKVVGDVKSWQPAEDGSAVLNMADGTSVAIDFSKTSGADGMLVTTGEAEGARIDLGGTPLTFRFLTGDPEPVPQVQGDNVVIGDQTVSLENGGIVLGRFVAR